MKIKPIDLSAVKVISLPNRLIREEWQGMNHMAAKELGIEIDRLNEHTVAIDQSLSQPKRKLTFKYEVIEMHAMMAGMSYKSAHRMATMLEKYDVNRINDYLKKRTV